MLWSTALGIGLRLRSKVTDYYQSKAAVGFGVVVLFD